MFASAHMVTFETEAKQQGFRFILGVDEAGRGPLAGPVVAAAVCLRTFDFDAAINDSKKMTAKARECALHEIFDKAYVGIGCIGEAAIDIVNILNASHLAMEAAVRQLVGQLPSQNQIVVLVDGNSFRHQLPFKHRTIVGGDAKSISIASASIVAKVYRDRIMDGYGRIFPQYGFAKHKGYPTAVHRQAIAQHGPSIIHRRSFTLI